MLINRKGNGWKIILLIAIGLALLFFWWLKIERKNNSIKNKIAEERQVKNDSGNVLVTQFFDKKTFFDALVWMRNNPKDFSGCKISSAVVPHHLLAGFMPARLFAELALQKVETIFVIGPNHWEQGEKIITSDAAWETPFGNVFPDMQIISELEKSGLVKIENAIMQKEHSTTGLFPLLKYYLPDTKIVPIILSAKNNQEEMDRLNGKLNDYLSDQKNVLVVSVDFSHYLNQNEAEKKDQETLEIIQKVDYKKLFELGNDNVDSPSSLATFFSATQKFGKGDIQVIEHANSADILGGNVAKTTSYYSLVSCRGDK